jgi:hypothetical protein
MAVAEGQQMDPRVREDDGRDSSFLRRQESISCPCLLQPLSKLR